MRPFRTLGYALSGLVLLAALHVGAYYATVEKLYASSGINGSRWVIIAPVYAIEGSSLFFGPAHELDRWFRPDYWARR